MIRRVSSVGAADSEYGCDRVQPGPERKRQLKNWPAATGMSRRFRPRIHTETTSGLSRTTAVTRRSWAKVRYSGTPIRQMTMAATAAIHSPHQ